MATLKDDDCLLVGRDGVDYRVQYDDLVKGLEGDLTSESGIEEAPNDGEQYVRQSETWQKVEIPSAVGINEVLAEGNTADPGQSLRFRIENGDISPIKRDTIDIDGGSGLRLGGLASFYTINEPFTLDTDSGATDFARCQRRITAVDDYYYSEDSRGRAFSTGVGVSGINFQGDDAHLDIVHGEFDLAVGDYDAPLLSIEARTSDGFSSITAGEFIGDGSKLTNLPGGGGGGSISEVLAEGNTADPGQSLHFGFKEGDIPPYKRDTIEFDNSAGLSLSGMVSYYHINKPLSIDTGAGDVSHLQFASRQISAIEDSYWAKNDQGDVFNSVGLQGYRFRDSGTFTEIGKRGIRTWVEDKDDSNNHILDIDVNVSSGKSSIKAGEFIGDGSKLTNLPIPDVNLDEYAKLNDSAQSITASEFIGDGSKLTNLPSGSTAWNDITGKPSAFPPAAHEHGEYAKLSDATQSITASEFIGNGSKLTGVALPDFRTLTPLS